MTTLASDSETSSSDPSTSEFSNTDSQSHEQENQAESAESSQSSESNEEAFESSESEEYTQPADTELLESESLVLEAQDLIDEENYPQARLLLNQAIELYSHNLEAFTLLSNVLTELHELKEALEIKIMRAQILAKANHTNSPFQELLDPVFKEFGDSMNFLICCKFMFKYAESDEQKKKFYFLLKNQILDKLTSHSEHIIKEYYAKSLNNFTDSLKIANFSTKIAIYKKAIEFFDKFDDDCMNFIRENIESKMIFELIFAMYKKKQNEELTLLLGYKAGDADQSLIERLSGAIYEISKDNLEKISFGSYDYYAYLVHYLEKLAEMSPKVYIEKFKFQVAVFELNQAAALNLLGNQKQAIQLLQKVMKADANLDIKAKARVVCAEILLSLDLKEEAGILLIQSISLTKQEELIYIKESIPFAQKKYFDCTFFFAPQGTAVDVMRNGLFRAQQGLYMLKVGKSDVALELLYLPLIQAISLNFTDVLFFSEFNQIIAQAFKCADCKKQFPNVLFTENEYKTHHGLEFFSEVNEIARLFKQAGIQQLIIQVLDLLKISTYHSQRCSKLRYFALIYLINSCQKTKQLNLEEQMTQQIVSEIAEMAPTLGFSKLNYTEERMKISKEFAQDKSLIIAFTKNVIAQNEPQLHQNCMKIVKRYLKDDESNIFLLQALMMLNLEKRTNTAQNIQLAQRLYTLTHQLQYLEAEALCHFRFCHTKLQKEFEKELLLGLECLRQFIIKSSQISGKVVAEAIYNSASILLCELGQIQECAEMLIKLLDEKRLFDEQYFVGVVDPNLRLLCLWQLGICYECAGNDEATILLRKEYFSKTVTNESEGK